MKPIYKASNNNENKAKFTTGSTMRHVVMMTMTGAVGLISIFFVDFLSMFYISMLGDPNLTAGVGYASTVIFLTVSINIGLMIAGSALVSRALGAGKPELARQLAASGLSFAVIFSIFIALLLYYYVPSLLDALGAKGVSKDVGVSFLRIANPVAPLMSVGMMCAGILRAAGDAKRSMYVTLYGGLVTAVFDPLLIFWAGLGTDGAAIAVVISRFVFVGVGLYGVVRVHNLLEIPRVSNMKRDIGAFLTISIPAILTNIATPVGGLLFLKVIAPFGSEAVAAIAVIDRIIPLAFGPLFSLSAAVGPILGQNLGARLYTRLRHAMRDAFIFCFIYSLLAWIILVLLKDLLPIIFHVDGIIAHYLQFFCLVGGAAWIFIGFILVSNAAFNNLGFPVYATVFNWGRATLGTLPLAYLGSKIAGVEGAMIGVLIGSSIFGVGAIFVVSLLLRRLELQHAGGVPVLADATGENSDNSSK